MSIADWLESLGKRSQQHKQGQRHVQNAPYWRGLALANAASMCLVPHLTFSAVVALPNLCWKSGKCENTELINLLHGESLCFGLHWTTDEFLRQTRDSCIEYYRTIIR